MKLVRFGAHGRERAGVLDLHNRPRDLSGVLADITAETVQQPAFSAIRSIDAERLPLVEPQVRLGPCIGRVGKLVCVGLNYLDHAREAGTSAPSEPVLFMKATSAISGPTDAIEIPVGASKVDWEVELGVVIGSKAKSVSVAAALEHVLGYCVVNDVSERAFQLEGTGQWVKGKSADTFAPIGPWLVTADEVPDPQNLSLWLRVNGRMRQKANTREMIFGVAFIVSYVSRFMTLMPGDIIATGTPPGVGLGATPPTFLQKGDVVTLGIDGLGEQRQELVGA
jgi:2-keto-4-pentenoate hydratase/2-oxohepta-3-ene-1,7-dioic acid hydratase in catechol pathway